jgi:hypothetical protein
MEQKGLTIPAAKDIKMSQYGKSFKETNGDLTVEIAPVATKNEDGLQDALIKISGPAAEQDGIDGKVMYYVAVPAGTGFNYVYMKGSSEAVRMTTRDSWESWKNFEIYVDGKTFRIYVDDKLSKEVMTQHLLTAYKQNN